MGLAGLDRMTPDEIADRCRALGARVEFNNHKIAIYPPDLTHRPVFISRRFGTGKNDMDRRNALSNLRRAGIDLTEEPEMPSPAEMPAQRPKLVQDSKMPHSPDELLSLIAELEARLSAVEGVNETLSAQLGEAQRRLVKHRSTLDTHRAELDVHFGQLEDLGQRTERLESASGDRGPSRSELVRRAVLGYLQSIPGVPQTPQIIESVLAEREALPAGLGKTAVAGACGELAKSGVLEAGGKTGPFRGTYRFPLPKKEDA